MAVKSWEFQKFMVGCLMVVVVLNIDNGVLGKPQVPCYFIFGDSLVDNGNNNNIKSLAKANYYPYGIDFPGGPTGRFSNGKTTVDVLAELFGFDNPIPPYAEANSQNILRGVNYASAAAGIRDETGQHLGARFSFNEQLVNHKNIVSRILKILGNNKSVADYYLSKCIYSVGVGSNDYLNNYFMPLWYSTSRQYRPEQYAQVLIQQYVQQIKVTFIILLFGVIFSYGPTIFPSRRQFTPEQFRFLQNYTLKTLHSLGARKFALIGVGQIGCTPNALAEDSPDGKTCVQRINSVIQIFNNKLLGLVDQLNSNHNDAKFIYINAYGIFQDLINNASALGFRVTNAACCGVGRNNGQITCLFFQIPCVNRNQYLFWDAYHPTEAANIIVARRSYIAEKKSDAYPVDLRRLALL